MHISKATISNFRLLEDIHLSFEDRTTVIVGRNNSGKTSLTELFRRILSDNSPTFKLEDFSLGVHNGFWLSYLLWREGQDEATIRKTLPFIEVRLTVLYDKLLSDVGPLSDFIIDLNPDCVEAIIVIRYQLEDGKISPLFSDIDLDSIEPESEKKSAFFKALKITLTKNYKPNLLAVDPNDETNHKALDWSHIKSLLQSGFINAQRGLDDTTHRENDVLGKILESLFKNAKSNSADPNDRDTAEKLETAVENIQDGLDAGFNEQLRNLLPAFKVFGYPGLSDPKLRTETTLDVERLLKDHTKVLYSGINGVHLPEAYNGLGIRNLIFMLLKLLEYFKSYKTKQPSPAVHLIFIEEPEAHLHPQMQEVFISKLSEISNIFSSAFNDGQSWPVQFIVSTHSSHLANKAPFEAMRYFFSSEKPDHAGVHFTKVKDLKKGFGSSTAPDKEFLHKYMTLTRCDLLFADKAILIEGPTERILMPTIIEKIDSGQQDGHKLGSQYISTMEVGGAYAHIFFPLLDFLELPTLIITDLDAINQHGNACKVSEGLKTSNGCIKLWFGNPSIPLSELLSIPDEKKATSSRRLAYQVPEAQNQPCGRTFEDAFILANPSLFGLGEIALEDDAWVKAHSVKKTEFALEFAINRTTWKVPRYIAEGLHWLANSPAVGKKSVIATSVVALPAVAPTIVQDKP